MNTDYSELDPGLNALTGDCSADALKASIERRQFARSTAGSITRALDDALFEYKRAKENGIDPEHAAAGFSEVLRSVFRTGRSSECDACDGTGYREKFCTHDVRCARRKCSLAEPEYEHAYVVPCDCSRGDRFRRRVSSETDQIAAAGRVSKQPSRFGSR